MYSIKAILALFALTLLIISALAHLAVRLFLKPRETDDLDDYHWEFEEQHPRYARYLKANRITFSTMIVAATILLLAAFL